ncbi:hypothetical protein [Streptomyces filamentosus]|uniref:hypothetical protein n=1 Tax=Streptomyces filamentosus TaxID=67294 RepID=UPI001239FE46|nr:hypothetical protein [Streptomyces filamentosus]KAA6220036.1 hypothetical protein CP979_26425 [Streptomyces filamentosus]
MTTRENLISLILAGHSDRAIHRLTGTNRKTVARIRVLLELAPTRKPRVPDSVIEDKLKAGESMSTVMRTCGVSQKRVREIRDRLGIPSHRPGPKPETISEIFYRRAVPTDDGHLIWPSTDYHLRARADGVEESVSAARWAFQQQHGRTPVGHVTAGCGTPRCVRPDHVEDQQMRNQYAAIFG